MAASWPWRRLLPAQLWFDLVRRRPSGNSAYNRIRCAETLPRGAKGGALATRDPGCRADKGEAGFAGTDLAQPSRHRTDAYGLESPRAAVSDSVACRSIASSSFTAIGASSTRFSVVFSPFSPHPSASRAPRPETAIHAPTEPFDFGARTAFDRVFFPNVVNRRVSKIPRERSVLTFS